MQKKEIMKLSDICGKFDVIFSERVNGYEGEIFEGEKLISGFQEASMSLVYQKIMGKLKQLDPKGVKDWEA